MSQVASITVSTRPEVQYLLRLGATCLILAQRLSEWCGHAPILEEDMALTNMAQDLIGQARAVLTRAGQLSAADTGEPLDEDQLAFLRDERDYLNPTLVELPKGDFAFTVLRNAVVATWLRAMWERLADSSDAELAAIAGKAVKEARYHQQHAADWVVRLGDGTAESAGRMAAAVKDLWRYVPELFEDDAVDAAAAAAKLGPAASELRAGFDADMAALFAVAKLQAPKLGQYRSTGKRGVHSEHMGRILTEMQYLQRAFPGGVW
ncbi:MAG: phenylacetate-CoA oxygenase subunit PaaC [Vitreoscilla sp.]|nr:phenylacetate-CoA oxygenase subunit PaaC [Vitreoscilla sp.]